MGFVTEFVVNYYASGYNRLGKSGAAAIHADDPQEVAQTLQQVRASSTEKLVTLYEALKLRSKNAAVGYQEMRRAKRHALAVGVLKEAALVRDGFTILVRARR